MSEFISLNNGHWVFREYKQRMSTSQWRQLLLEERDTILYRGDLVRLKGVRVGPGVYEVFKDLPKRTNQRG